MPTWYELGQAGQEQVMSGWIDAAWNSGMQIVFTNNPALAQAGTGLARIHNRHTRAAGGSERDKLGGDQVTLPSLRFSHIAGFGGGKRPEPRRLWGGAI